MQHIHILLAEDEVLMGKIIKEALESRGFTVTWVTDGLKAFSSFRAQRPDICIFDVMMPVQDGFTVAKEIRKIDNDIPILFLTAKSSTADIVEGFELGANDYLKKPFSMEELIVRIKSQLKRSAPIKETSTSPEIAIGKYKLNFESLSLQYGPLKQDLTFKEAMLLKMLVDNKNGVLDRSIALKYIWGDDSYLLSRSMDVFITKLRRMLSKDTDIKIVNIRGIGFKLIINE
ncbi:response regulator transcription factor [Sphingobacterium spiritivorum]|uniref:response regulator transcription factor n=1 Tax=Sphingobacterium spiritivorum TaxID=258 RepID=UPI00191A493D|nr:response regulator transcription factor [Sphingobacterium spiritivorum]QQT26051.1 response regulator transcription factor [Sphingobacterium spiritivorum]